jgi:hypothetical protein
MRTPCCLPSFASNWTKSETQHLREVSLCPLTVLTMPESKAATQKLHLLVPNEDKRKNYLRLFKWVVSFATWRYGADSTSGLGKGDGVDDAGYTLQARDCTSSRLTALLRATALSHPRHEGQQATNRPKCCQPNLFQQSERRNSPAQAQFRRSRWAQRSIGKERRKTKQPPVWRRRNPQPPFPLAKDNRNLLWPLIRR